MNCVQHYFSSLPLSLIHIYVEIVRQGAPTDMDNPETVARWLDAMANLERRNAQFNEFQAEWMRANGNPGPVSYTHLDVYKGQSPFSTRTQHLLTSAGLMVLLS